MAFRACILPRFGQFRRLKFANRATSVPFQLLTRPPKLNPCALHVPKKFSFCAQLVPAFSHRRSCVRPCTVPDVEEKVARLEVNSQPSKYCKAQTPG